MKIPPPKPVPKARIEIIAMIDIMVFLLAIYILISTTMIKNKGIEVTLPSAATATPQDTKPNRITVSVDAAGVIYFDKDVVALDGVLIFLQNIAAKDPETRIVLQADAAASYGTIVKLYDAARSAGLYKIVLSTKPPGAGGPPAAPGAAPAPAPAPPAPSAP